MLLHQNYLELRDATDLNWVQLLNAYSCTECGRCTDSCPANQTGNYFLQGKYDGHQRQNTEIADNKRKGERTLNLY